VTSTRDRARRPRHLRLVADNETAADPAPVAQSARRGFAWSCRKGVIEDGRVTEVHEVVGDDGKEYERHMRAHGFEPLKGAYEPLKLWRPPRPAKSYQPKPMDPGPQVEWDKVTPAHWDGRDWADPSASPGNWVEEVRETRTGVIWSVADTASAWWIQPDDDPAHPVYVRRAGKRDRYNGRSEGSLYEEPGRSEAARANVLRGEEVRKRGIFPVIDSQRSEYGARSRRTSHIYISWHSDVDCPRAAGKGSYDPNDRPQGVVIGYLPSTWGIRGLGQKRWTALDVAYVLNSDVQPPGELCPECITGLDVDGLAESAGTGTAQDQEAAPGAIGTVPAALPGLAGELSGDSPYRAALTALDGYAVTAAGTAQATDTLEAQLTIHGFDRDHALMGHVTALHEAAAVLQAHAAGARAGLLDRHATGADYHATGRDALASAFRTTATEGAQS
jgi:hypothetical protein